MPRFYIDLMLKYLINHKRGGGGCHPRGPPLNPPLQTTSSLTILLELKQRCFLSDARQPKVRLFLYLYALKQLNLYCKVSSLFKRRFTREFGQNHWPRMQNLHIRLTIRRSKTSSLISLMISKNSHHWRNPIQTWKRFIRTSLTTKKKNTFI